MFQLFDIIAALLCETYVFNLPDWKLKSSLQSELLLVLSGTTKTNQKMLASLLALYRWLIQLE